MTVLVTSWSPQGETLYGRKFLENAHKWNLDGLLVYEEQDSGRADHVNLLKLNTWFEFDRRWGSFRSIKGLDRSVGSWKPEEIKKGYCYRYDGWKFLRKLFALADAAIRHPNRTLVWSDGDVQVFKEIPPGFFDDLASPNQVAYFGRDRPHSECGIVVYGGTVVAELVTWMMNRCVTGQFMKNEKGWTDCHVFDDAREIFPWIGWRDLTEGRRSGAVIETSVLGRHLTHLKGDRKYEAHR